MSKVKIKIEGAKELRRALEAAGPRGVKALAKVLREESQLIFRESQKQVPHADGILAGSGVLQPPKVSGDHVSIAMGYGGAASAYALVQHEDLSLSHPDPRNPGKSKPSGKAKYLEDPMREALPRIRANLSKSVQDILRGMK